MAELTEGAASGADASGAIAPPPITTRVKVLYSIGGFAYSANLPLLGLLLLFYNQLVGLPPQWVSLALSISLVVDAVWDPLVGYLSDNLRGPLGRRHPLMYASAIPFAVCWSLLFLPPRGWSNAGHFAWLLIFITTSRMLQSLFEVPATALTPELAPEYHARTDLFSYRYVFGAMAGVVAGLLGYGVFLRATPAHPVGQLNQAGYGPYAVTVAVVSAAAILIAATGTHGWIRYLHRPAPRRSRLGPMLREVWASLFSGNFATITLSGLFTGVSTGLSGGLAIYFNTYFWELPSSALLVLTLTGIFAVPLAAVVASLLSRPMGKKAATMTLTAGALAATIAPFVLRFAGLMPSNGTTLLIGVLFVTQVLGAICSGAALILFTSMLSDVVEESELRTGRRSEGLLMSSGTMLQKVLTGFSTILPGVILALIHFPSNARPGAVSSGVLRGLVLLSLPAAAIMSLTAIVCLGFYGISRTSHEANLLVLRREQSGNGR
jgi:glycoside/pentoside/hexuronide:cation symporter, GPH family